MSGSSFPLILKISDWPRMDRDLWNRSLISGGLFDAHGAFYGWSDGTRRLHAQNYGSWLSFITRTQSRLLETHPTARITLTTVKAFIEEGHQRLKARSIANQISSLAIIAQGFAPDQDWDWLFYAARVLYEQSNPHQLKPPFPVTAAALFEWSLVSLQDAVTCCPTNPLAHAVAFRQALMVGLLIARPVRARAFVVMTVSHHLDVSDHTMTLCFGADDMKDRKARRFPVPEALIPFMELYLNRYRPILLQGQSSDALWISQNGVALNQDSFTSGLALLTKRVFGMSLRPHAFRHIAATSIATLDPDHVGIIRDILGHATLRMAERHYNRATAVKASLKLQNILRGFRRNNKTSSRSGHLYRHSNNKN